MKRVFLSNFKEYGSETAPSIAEMRSGDVYSGKEKIVKYLAESGDIGLVTAKSSIDRVTGEKIGGALVLRETDRFAWWSDLAYHVEKYNLRLPKEFEDYVLNQ